MRNLYVGEDKKGAWRIFVSPVEPSERSHGDKFKFAIGPFRTVRGAIFMARYGRENPHCRSVADAERLGQRLE